MCEEAYVCCLRRRSSLSKRCSSRVTVVRCHLPPCGVAISRSFNSRAMPLMETKPALRSLRIVGRRASARTSATRLVASPLLVPPLHRFKVAQARQHPRYGGAMPPPAAGSRYPPSVQFIRESTIGNEACRHKLPNGREQSKGAGVCGPFIGQRTVHLAPAGRSFPAYWLHRAIMAAF